ncbi:hypothetical protein ACF0H5_000560 [Mactra antiquata]
MAMAYIYFTTGKERRMDKCVTSGKQLFKKDNAFPDFVYELEDEDGFTQIIHKKKHVDSRLGIRFDVCEHEDRQLPILRRCSPVVDAWCRWNNVWDIEDKELAAIINVSKSSASVGLVRKYLLGYCVIVHIEDVKEVLEISSMLLLNDLVNYCKYRIQDIELNTDNVMEVLEVTSLFDFVHPNMKQFIRSHLSVLFDIEGSESLTYETLLYLLTDEEHLYWTMKSRFIFIVKWCEASQSRIKLFQSLFDLIDLRHLDTDFMASVVNINPLVLSSKYCLRRIDDHRKEYADDILTPAVIMLDIELSEMFAFSLENSIFCKIDIPTEVLSRDISAWTVLLPDYIVIITSNVSSRREFIKYNINSGLVQTKRFVESSLCKGEINHFLCQDEQAFFVEQDSFSVEMKDECTNTSKRNKKKRQHTTCKTETRTKTVSVPFSTVFVKRKENNHIASFQPLMSFRFKITQMCIYKSRLLVKADSEEYIYCYDLERNILKRLIPPREFYDYTLLSLLHLHDTLFAVFPSFIIQLALDEMYDEIQRTQKDFVDIGSDPFVTLATGDSFLRIDNECIYAIEMMESSLKLKSKKYFYGTSPYLKEDYIHFAYLGRDTINQHLKYPNCDINTDIEYFDDDDVDFREMVPNEINISIGTAY